MEAVETLEKNAIEEGFVHRKGDAAGQADLQDHKEKIPRFSKTFRDFCKDVWSPDMTELPKSFHAIQSPNVKAAVLDIIRKELEPYIIGLLQRIGKCFGVEKKGFQKKIEFLSYLFPELVSDGDCDAVQDDDDDFMESEDPSNSAEAHSEASSSHCDHDSPTSHDHSLEDRNDVGVQIHVQTSKPRRKMQSPLTKYVIGTMKNPRIKEFLMKELRTNEDVQKAFRYITKSFLPDEMEGSRGLTAENISVRKYQAMWKISPRTRRNCATPVRRICRQPACHIDGAIT
eukprot:756614-Hanusia_phi.AAC.1